MERNPIGQDDNERLCLVIMIISVWIPEKEGNFLTTSMTISFSRRFVTVEIFV